MTPVYPFSAVVGQDSLKLALVLCAIDPAIGGVLVTGPRGVAKTTLARALAELVEGPFVELPLGATEERVAGSLDLEAALREARVQFSPGLLARAHGGVLYVDEVNLLPDPLVDLLLDAAGSGANTVERDGISHSHAARFVLVGTMNPDEGELRPQLVDRFGLSAQAEGELVPAVRAAIITRRLAFESDPGAFLAEHADAQAVQVARCRAARALLSTIALTGDALTLVTERCHAAGVEGVRADLAMLRAARAHAAFHGRTEILPDDVDAVAELALAHRRRHPPTPRGGSPAPSGGGNAGGGSRGTAGTTGAGTRGALAPVPVRSQAVTELPAWLVAPAGAHASTRRYGRARVRSARGLRGATQADGAIDWFASLARGRPRRREQLTFRARRSAAEQLWVVAVDCSSSMLRAGALARAKGVAEALEARARRAGASLALVSFRGAEARTELVTAAGRTAFARALDGLGGGGGTPLAQALAEVTRLATKRAVRPGAVAKRLVLLTDGRVAAPSTAPLSALDTVVIDCERGPVRLGRARVLARALGARYAHVDRLSGSSSARAES